MIFILMILFFFSLLHHKFILSQWKQITYYNHSQEHSPTKHMCILVPAHFFANYLHKFSEVVQIMHCIDAVWDKFAFALVLILPLRNYWTINQYITKKISLTFIHLNYIRIIIYLPKIWNCSTIYFYFIKI